MIIGGGKPARTTDCGLVSARDKLGLNSKALQGGLKVDPVALGESRYGLSPGPVQALLISLDLPNENALEGVRAG